MGGKRFLKNASLNAIKRFSNEKLEIIGRKKNLLKKSVGSKGIKFKKAY
jgi:hypothetical protein